MLNQSEVGRKLHEIHYSRNKHNWLFHVMLIILSTYFQREKIFGENYWWFAFILIGLGVIFRNLFVRVFYAKWTAGNRFAAFLNYLGMFTLAMGWSCHFYAVFRVFGPDSYNTSQTLLNIAVIIMGAALSSAAHKKSFQFLALPTLTSIFLLYLLASDSSDEAIMTYLLTFYTFSFYFITIGNKELIRSIENEIAIEQDRDRMERIIDTVPGFVSIYNKDLVCIIANKIMLAMYPTIVGQKIGGLETGSDWEDYIVNFHKSDKTMAVNECASFVGGRDRWTIRNCRKNVDGGVVFVSTEITELVEARKKLREQEAKAHFSAKLASLGEMAAGIAHEINNPLAIIQGSASVIQKLVDIEPMDRDSVKLLTSKMIETTNRISKTIKSLKSLSRSGDNDPFENVELAKLIDQCVDISRQRIERHEIVLKLPAFETPVIFKAREVQISQVLMNLLSNAIDACRVGENSWIEISYKVDEKFLDILVSDSGPGIPQEIRDKIMEPFFTTKEVNQGTGLGLSISKSILRAHKGELSVQDGLPTTFRIHLPMNGSPGDNQS